VGRPALYGSPTLFDEGAGAWNLGRLDTILRRYEAVFESITEMVSDSHHTMHEGV
jgi:hypothetical protein